MRKILTIVPLLAALSHGAFAAPAAAPTPQPSPSPTPARAKAKATPAPAAATASPSPAASPAASPTPKPKKAGLLHRIFIGESPTPKPTATATPTPTPKPRRRVVPTATPGGETPTATPAASPSATPEVKAPKATPTPKPAEATPTPAPKMPKLKATTPPPASAGDENTGNGADSGDDGKKQSPSVMTNEVPFVPEATPEPEATPQTPTVEEDESKSKARYKELKAQILQDKDIQALKAKADAATSDDAQRDAAKAYYKALFKKMRAADPSIGDYLNRMEKAMMKRLDQ